MNPETMTEQERRDYWDGFQYFVACIDGNIECSDDQCGVVLNACSHDALAYGD